MPNFAALTQSDTFKSAAFFVALVLMLFGWGLMIESVAK